MGRPRKHHRHLPQGMSLERGTYYFRRKPAPRVNLGQDFEKALSWYARQAVPGRRCHTIADVIERYRIEVLPLKRSAATREDQARQLVRLGAVFGHMRPDDLTAPQCYEYLDRRQTQDGTPAPVAARHEISLLGHVLAKAIRWGGGRTNVVRNLERLPKSSRRRYVTDDEFSACQRLATPQLAVAMDLARLTGQRIGDLLSMRREQITDAGIVIRQGKTGAGVLIEITPALQSAIDTAFRLAPQIPREYVIRARHGGAYTARGFKAMWQRLMRKFVAQGGTRFTFHDLRAKAGSDKATIEEAQALLGHASSETTKRVYKRNLTRARPVE